MSQFVGRKVFFLNPHSVIQDELVYEIVKNEYEAYLVFDYKRLIQILREYTDSIIFINIDDDSMPEAEWEKYITNILKDRTLDVKIGILTYNSSPELSKKYLMDVGVQCGFVVLKLGLEQSRKIILATLEANEAKGQRMFVRAQCMPNAATFNLKFRTDLIKGQINDISSVGMSCFFDSRVDPAKGTLFKEVQLILKGKIVRVDAIVMGKREVEGSGFLYVLLFSKKINPGEKQKIHRYIYETLQQNLNAKMGV
ncbi:MAG: PilZ domain-containing protein [Spirochaetales bacterium]|nr:PilZ domain-containing protein [Spirochaetales bacterium]